MPVSARAGGGARRKGSRARGGSRTSRPAKPAPRKPEGALVVPTGPAPSKEEAHKLKISEAFHLFSEVENFVQAPEARTLMGFTGLPSLDAEYLQKGLTLQEWQGQLAPHLGSKLLEDLQLETFVSSLRGLECLSKGREVKPAVDRFVLLSLFVYAVPLQ